MYPLTTQPPDGGPTDAALVGAARRGEPWAQEALFRRYAARANALALRLLGRETEVDDVVQDAFIEALDGLHRLSRPEAFSAWLSGIVVRKVYRVLRRHALWSRLGFRRLSDSDFEALVSPMAPPDVALELRELYGIVASMAPELRVPLLLRRVEGLTLEEIAESVGCSLATAKRRLAAAQVAFEQATTSKEHS